MYRSLFVFLAIVISFSCNNEKAETGKETNVPGGKTVSAKVKAHECTAACKDGNHSFMHNEVGHTCSSDCGTPHVCGDQCKDATHVYAHGEVGHYCMCTPGS